MALMIDPLFSNSSSHLELERSYSILSDRGLDGVTANAEIYLPIRETHSHLLVLSFVED
jgi:hypothetical protein